jgi:hypothetical protein
MKKLSAKTIRNVSLGYFAFSGFVFLAIVASTNWMAIGFGIVVFGLSIMPILLPFKIFRLLYGIAVFAISSGLLLFLIIQSLQWTWTSTDLNSFLFSFFILSAYLVASLGLALSAVSTSDPKRFTLI